MLAIVGIVVTFAMVFGGYIAAGGKMDIIIKALPFEMMMIGGAALGSFLIANGGTVAKGALKAFGRVFKGPQWKRQDYADLLCLLFALLKTMRTRGMVALEAHIENPEASSIFSRYPKILHDHHVVDFICDTLRVIQMDVNDPHQVGDALDRQLKKHHKEALGPGDAIQTTADAAPALGIVAAVLGVIKTMASIDQPPEVLGKLIGGALVGTFLGVFLAYALIGPFASRYKQIVEEEGQFFAVIRDAIIAHLSGTAPQLSIELARGNIPSSFQPSFATVDEMIAKVEV